MYDDCHSGDPPRLPPGCTCSGIPGEDHSQCPICGPQPHAKLVPITEKRSFDFSSETTPVGGPAVYVVLCPSVYVLAYTRLRLCVRVHSLTMSSGQLLRFHVWNTLPSEEDPGQDFVDVTSLTTADIDSTTAVPSLVTSTQVTDPGAYVKLSVRIIQAGVPATLQATLSVSLLLRMN